MLFFLLKMTYKYIVSMWKWLAWSLNEGVPKKTTGVHSHCNEKGKEICAPTHFLNYYSSNVARYIKLTLTIYIRSTLNIIP